MSFTSDNTTYGTVSPASVTKPYGTEITVNNNAKTVTIDGVTVTATEETAPT